MLLTKTYAHNLCAAEMDSPFGPHSLAQVATVSLERQEADLVVGDGTVGDEDDSGSLDPQPKYSFCLASMQALRQATTICFCNG